MQLDTVLKVGSLAFSVAQDDHVRELFSMVHKGARRRGLIGAMPPPQSQAGAPKPASAPAKKPEAPIPFAPEPKPAAPVASGPDLSKLLNGQNAKKLLGVAGQIGQMLMK